MEDTKKTKRLDLPERVTFNDKSYGPGKNVEVPADFPLAKEGSEAAPTPDRIFSKPTSSPPNSGGVNTGETDRLVEITESSPPTGAVPAAPGVPAAPPFSTTREL